MGVTTKKKFVFRIFESIIVTLYIVFEEIVWNLVAYPIISRIRSLNLLKPFRKFILSTNRYLLLIIFISMLGISELMGVLSFSLLVKGHLIPSIIIYVTKLPLAVFTFWVFDTAKEKLMTFYLLRVIYEFITKVINIILESDVHKYIKRKITSIKSSIKKTKNKIKVYFSDILKRNKGDKGILFRIKRHYTVLKPKIKNAFKRSN